MSWWKWPPSWRIRARCTLANDTITRSLGARSRWILIIGRRRLVVVKRPIDVRVAFATSRQRLLHHQIQPGAVGDEHVVTVARVADPGGSDRSDTFHIVESVVRDAAAGDNGSTITVDGRRDEGKIRVARLSLVHTHIQRCRSVAAITTITTPATVRPAVRGSARSRRAPSSHARVPSPDPRRAGRRSPTPRAARKRPPRTPVSAYEITTIGMRDAVVRDDRSSGQHDDGRSCRGRSRASAHRHAARIGLPSPSYDAQRRDDHTRGGTTSDAPTESSDHADEHRRRRPQAAGRYRSGTIGRPGGTTAAKRGLPARKSPIPSTHPSALAQDALAGRPPSGPAAGVPPTSRIAASRLLALPRPADPRVTMKITTTAGPSSSTAAEEQHLHLLERAP